MTTFTLVMVWSPCHWVPSVAESGVPLGSLWFPCPLWVCLQHTCLLDLTDRLVSPSSEKHISIISTIRLGNTLVTFTSMWTGESKGFIYIYILNFRIWTSYLINISISRSFSKVHFNHWYNIQFRFSIVMSLHKRLKGKIPLQIESTLYVHLNEFGAVFSG